MKKLAWYFMFFPILYSSPAVGNDSQEDRATLRGVKEVAVVIGLNSELKRVGLTKEQLQTDTELRLRRSGIRVASSQVPFLAINITALEGPGVPLNAILVSVAFRQLVSLIRNPDIKSVASTWSVEGVAMVGDNRVEERIRSYVADSVDEFINAYLAENSQ
ncbi:MAG: hypothetical protein HYS38_07220 [Acidobacteria bacterium]|nr:hypothetical protein [Acidobacteriota bacterium]